MAAPLWAQSYSWSPATHKAIGGDFNGDGRTDLLLQAFDEFHETFISFSFHQPNERFHNYPLSIYDTNVSLSASSAQILAADFNGDGFDDLLIVPLGNADFHLLLSDTRKPENNPNGNFQLSHHQQFNLSQLSQSANRKAFKVNLADINGDYQFDLILQPTRRGGKGYIAYSDDSGKFTRESTSQINIGIDLSAAENILHLADFDGDLRDDILVQKINGAGRPHSLILSSVGGQQNGISKQNNYQRRVIEISNELLGLNWNAEISNLSLADFDNDGLMDLVLDSLVASDLTFPGEQRQTHFIKNSGLRGTRKSALNLQRCHFNTRSITDESDSVLCVPPQPSDNRATAPSIRSGATQTNAIAQRNSFLTGVITASPNPCILTSPTGTCSTQIDAMRTDPLAGKPSLIQSCVFLEGASTPLFCGENISQPISWINQAGYTFIYNASNGINSAELDRVTVTGYYENPLVPPPAPSSTSFANVENPSFSPPRDEDGQFQFCWSGAGADVDYYEWDYKLANLGWQPVGTAPWTSVTGGPLISCIDQTITQAASEFQYLDYRVRACNAAGCSIPTNSSTSIAISPQQLPEVFGRHTTGTEGVIGVFPLDTDGQFTVEWSDVDENGQPIQGVAEYRLEVFTVATEDQVLITEGYSQAVTIPLLPDRSVVFMSLYACPISGNNCDDAVAMSGPGSSGGIVIIQETAPPSIPGNISLNSGSGIESAEFVDSHILSWEASTGTVDTYEWTILEDGAVVQSGSANTNSVQVTGLQGQVGHLYDINVVASNLAGSSPAQSGQFLVVSPGTGPRSVTDVGYQWLTSAEDSVELYWSYPWGIFHTTSGKPSKFQIIAELNEQLVDEVIVGEAWQPQWNFQFNNDNFLGSTYRVRVCRGANSCDQVIDGRVGLLSSNQANFPPPVLQGEMEITVGQGQSFEVDWSAVNDPEVDYYWVRERISGPASEVTLFYSTEAGHLLRRNQPGTYEYVVAACRRDREHGDSCGTSSTATKTVTVTDQSNPQEVLICESSYNNGDWTLAVEYDQNAFFSTNSTPDYFRAMPFPYGDPIELKVVEFENRFGYSLAGVTSGTWQVQACTGTGMCGAAQILEVDNQTVIDDSNNSCTPPTQTQGLGVANRGNTGTPGGPDQLPPGEWYDPDYAGTGWSFYWNSGIDPLQGIFGETYDLFAFWFTYEERDGVWTPVWLYSVLKLDQGSNDTYRGSLIYNEQLGGGATNVTNVGTMSVQFDVNTANTSQVLVRIPDINGINGFDGEPFPLYEPHRLSFAPTFEGNGENCPPWQNIPDNEIEHYRGMWSKAGTDDPLTDSFTALNWIQKYFESMVVPTYDADGSPIWFRGETIDCNATPTRNNTIDLYAVDEGFDPRETTPPDFFNGGDGLDRTFIGEINRRYFESAFEISEMSFNFDLSSYVGRDGSLTITDQSSTKDANFHRIDFRIEGEPLNSPANTCYLNDGQQICRVLLTWYSHDNFQDIEVYRCNVQGTACSFIAEDLWPTQIDFLDSISSLTQGNYFYELRNPLSGTNDESVIARSGILQVSNDPPPVPEVDMPPPPALMSEIPTLVEGPIAVGSMLGGFEVNSNGAATYNIPILTVPGTGGLSPNVSLNYNSRADNGPMGMGWAIAGTSIITRCGQTVIHDGIPSAVTFNSQDRLCLDGQRLMNITHSDPNNYWLTDSEYRTELDQFARVSWVTPDEGGDYLLVELPNGSKSTYGRLENSRVIGHPGTDLYAWAQDTLKDSSGNFIRYKYIKFGGTQTVEFYLHKIRYTGHDADGDFEGDAVGDTEHEPFAEIVFDYETTNRTDVFTRYIGGAEFRQTRRLLRVVSSSQRNGNGDQITLRHYTPTYAVDGVGRSIVTEIQECGFDSSNTVSQGQMSCFAPTKFDWLESKTAINGSNQIVGLPQALNISSIRAVDFNGTGRQDLIYVDSIFTNNGPESTFAGALADLASTGVDVDFSNVLGLSTLFQFETDQIFEQGGRWAIMDYDANGFQDIIIGTYTIDEAGETVASSWQAIRWDGTNAELVENLGNLPPSTVTGRDPFVSASQIQVQDINADGYPDLIYQANDVLVKLGLYVSLHRGRVDPTDPDQSVFAEPVRIAEPVVEIPEGAEPLDSGPPGNRMRVRTADYNGDGAADFLAKYSQRLCPEDQSQQCSDPITFQCNIGGNDQAFCHSQWYVYIADGQGGFAPPEAIARSTECEADTCNTSLPLVDDDKVQLVDVNNDGLADLLYADQQGVDPSMPDDAVWKYRLNDGLGVAGMPDINIGEIPEGQSLRLVDIDGNGFLDLLYPDPTVAADSDSRTWVVRYWQHDGYQPVESTNIQAGDIVDDQDTSLFLDANGDGRTDHLFIDREPGVAATMANLVLGNDSSTDPGMNDEFMARNVINHITDGLDAEITIGYLPMSDRNVYTRSTNANQIDHCRYIIDSSLQANCQRTAVYDLILPVYLVSDVVTTAPAVDLSVDSDDNIIVNTPTEENFQQYYYQGAKLQGGGRGLLGFAINASYNLQNQLLSSSRLEQVFPVIGRPLQTRSEALQGMAADNPFPPSIGGAPDFDQNIDPCLDDPMNPVCDPCFGSMDCEPLRATGESGVVVINESSNIWAVKSSPADISNQALFPYATHVEQHSYDLVSGNLLLNTLTEIESVDDYGNPLDLYTDYVRVDDSTALRQSTSNLFENRTDTRWQLGLLNRVTVTSNRDDELVCVLATLPSVNDDCIARTISYTYDLATGLLEEETLEPDGQDRIKLSTSYSIDAYGNVTGTTIRNNNNIILRSNSLTYDDLHRLPVEQTNSYGQRVSSVFLNLYGNPLLIDDIDRVGTILTYDRMGRVYSSYNETGAWSNINYLNGPGFECPNIPGAETWSRIQSESGGNGLTTICIDQLGREIRTVEQPFDGLSATHANEFIYTDTYYDSVGRVSRISEPYFSGASENIVWNDVVYDQLSRPVLRSNANREKAWFEYDGLVTNFMDARGVLHAQQRNILGEISQVTDDVGGANQAVTSYEYNAVGDLIQVTDPEGHSQYLTYNVRGHRITLDDPDLGVLGYRFTALGELQRQFARRPSGGGELIEYSYDLLGRTVVRNDYQDADDINDTSPGGLVDHAVWVFNNQAAPVNPVEIESIGKLTSEYVERAGETPFSRGYIYDGLGRVKQINTTIIRDLGVGDNGESFVERFTYGSYSRLFQAFNVLGNNSGQQYHFTPRGYLESIRESANSSIGYAAYEDLNARGQVERLRYGNNQITRNGYDAIGRLTSIDTGGFGFNSEVQNLNYTYDELGNLKIRDDQRAEQKETFLYDALSRLRSVTYENSTGAQVVTQSLRYDRSGNILCRQADSACTSNPNVANYLYGQGSAGPHAATQYTDDNNVQFTYQYDFKGNQISRIGDNNETRDVTYSIFDKPISIADGNGRVTEFAYGTDRARYLRQDVLNGVLLGETVYVGNVEVVTRLNQLREFRRNIAGVAIATSTSFNSANPELVYTHRDHLNSVDTFTDSDGDVVNYSTGEGRLSFDAFGNRRDPENWLNTSYTIPQDINLLTQYGFTDQEHVDDLGFIHYNGRIYDPQLARFMQADPVVQFPLFGQSLNRYSYVLNNPATYTDSSGFEIDDGGSGIVIGFNAGIPVFGNSRPLERDPFILISFEGALLQVDVDVVDTALQSRDITPEQLFGMQIGGVFDFTTTGIVEGIEAPNILAEAIGNLFSFAYRIDGSQVNFFTRTALSKGEAFDNNVAALTLLVPAAPAVSAGASGTSRLVSAISARFKTIFGRLTSKFDLRSRLIREAADIIANSSQNQLRAKAALSRARVAGTSIETRSFTNLKGSVTNFPGIRRIDNDFFEVVDEDAFIDRITQLFAQEINILTPQVRARILDFVRGRQLSTGDGIPGLHAEVQAYNAVLRQIQNLRQVPLDINIQIGTIKLGKTSSLGVQGQPFKACTNCGGIIPRTVDVFTGRR